MQNLYLIRHGQSQANADQIIAGSHNSPLSDIGQQQAAYAGETAKQYLHFDLIVSSPMSRALETAQIIAHSLDYPSEKIEIIEDLRERNLGDVEGKTYAAAPQNDGNYEDAENVPGVEPLQHLFDRAAGVLENLNSHPEKSILIVAHNGCGRMLRVVAQGKEAPTMYDQPRLENAIFYKLVQNDEHRRGERRSPEA
jgi:broad specificity phosphatase PhoE